jgi:hypothetical protein
VWSGRVSQLSLVHHSGQILLAVADTVLVFREVYEWVQVQEASHWLDSLFFRAAFKAVVSFNFFLSCSYTVLHHWRCHSKLQVIQHSWVHIVALWGLQITVNRRKIIPIVHNLVTRPMHYAICNMHPISLRPVVVPV